MKRTFNATVTAIMLVLSFAAPVAAGQLEDAFAVYDRGDYATALRLYRSLADQGNARAQLNLGFMYANGQGVPQNDAEAAKWFRKAADQGFAQAEYNLGVMYANGQGVPRNDAEAVKWFRKAADQGFAQAQYNLGVRYANGQGVPKNYVSAYMWSSLAAAGDNDAAKIRDLATRQMTPGQIAEAQKLARDWKPTMRPTK